MLGDPSAPRRLYVTAVAATPGRRYAGIGTLEIDMVSGGLGTAGGQPNPNPRSGEEFFELPRRIWRW
jgi:hypothetical protein